MKSILMSIQPQWCTKILNGEKTIEIRKRFPLDYVGWVYMYITKDNSKENDCNVIGRCYPIDTALKTINGKGKVVARFWCNKTTKYFNYFYQDDDDDMQLLQCFSITQDELNKIVRIGGEFKAISITRLEIFDTPKELGEFHTAYKYATLEAIKDYERETGDTTSYRVKKAPQGWQYVEVEE